MISRIKSDLILGLSSNHVSRCEYELSSHIASRISSSVHLVASRQLCNTTRLFKVFRLFLKGRRVFRSHYVLDVPPLRALRSADADHNLHTHLLCAMATCCLLLLYR